MLEADHHGAPRTRRTRHVGIGLLLTLLAALLGSLTPVLSRDAAAVPTAARVVFPGWNVGATPRVCDIDSTIGASICSSVPITDASADGSSGVAAEDLNADGRTDVVINNQNGGVNVCLDDGAGGWTCTTHGPNGRHGAISLADLDNDGDTDIASVNETQSNMKVCLNSGGGSFTCAYQTTPSWTSGIAALRLDGDAALDLFITHAAGGAFGCINNGSASFSCTTLAGVPGGREVESGFLDLDAHADLVFVAPGVDDIVCYGSATFTFSCSTLDTGGTSYGADIDDLDGDSDPDVVIARGASLSRVCLNGGSRSFSCADLNAAIGEWRDVDIGDVTGDGVVDLAVGVQGVNLICAGDGAGDIVGCSAIDAGSSWNSTHVVVVEAATPPPDADGDGVIDSADNCPIDANPTQLDSDTDLAGNACDADDDNDGLLDVTETGVHGTDPLLADTDADGADDATEVSGGWNPLLPPIAQTITLTAPSVHHGGVGPFAVVLGSTSSLPVSLSAAGACSASGATVTPITVGSCQLTASQAGNGNYLAATALMANVSLTSSTQSVTLTAPSSMAPGTSVQVGATVTSGLPATLSVQGPCTLVGSTLSAVSTGSCVLSGDQPGQLWWDPAPTASTTIVVTATPAPTTTVVPIATAVPTTVAVPTASVVPITSVVSTTTTVPPLRPTRTTAPPAPTQPLSSPPATSAVTVATTTVSATTTPVERQDEAVEPDTVVVRRAVTDLQAEGLPQVVGAPVRIVITGEDNGASASISDGFRLIAATTMSDGSLVLDLPLTFRLVDSTLVVEHATGERTVITSSDRYVDGDVTLALRFDVVEGEDLGKATVDVDGEGFLPDSDVELWLHSAPRLLTQVAADANGVIDATIALPDDVEPGEHRVIAIGRTADGPLTGEWHFAISDDGVVERIGDPLGAGPTDIATGAGATPTIDPTSRQEIVADATPPTIVIDERTNLPVFSPADEPEQSMAAAVEALALLSLAGAGASFAAAGMAGSGTSAGGRASSSGRPGVAASGTAPGAGEVGRDEGSIASAEAADFGDGLEGRSWGDRSRTWRWPMTSRLDHLGTATAERLHPVSPLAARLVADGSTMRAMLGSGSLTLPILGATLGALAVGDTGGLPIAPSLGLFVALLVLGILDATAGWVGAAVFVGGVASTGGIDSVDAVRSLIGIGSLWFAVSLIAAATRPFRPSPQDGWAGRWTAIGDVVLGSLIAGWTVHGVVSALPALSGVDMPIAARADLVAAVAISAVATRYLVERLAMRSYPDRLAAVTFRADRDPSLTQQVVSILSATMTMAFIAEPYIGLGWQLLVVVVLVATPSFVGLAGDRVPASSRLYVVVPRGLPSIVVMVAIGTVVANLLANRIDDPEALLATSFVVLAIPGFVLAMLGLVGREGAEPAPSWTRRLSGTWVAIVVVLMVRGHIGDAGWLPVVLVTPLAVWWVWASSRPESAAPNITEDGPAQHDPSPEVEEAALVDEMASWSLPVAGS